MLKNVNKTVALTTLGVIALTAFGGLNTPAQASTSGRRNTTYGLGAVTAYGLLRHNKGLAIAGAVGTGIAYSRYRTSLKHEKGRRSSWYRRRYGRNWRAHYNNG